MVTSSLWVTSSDSYTGQHINYVYHQLSWLGFGDTQQYAKGFRFYIGSSSFSSLRIRGPEMPGFYHSQLIFFQTNGTKAGKELLRTWCYTRHFYWFVDKLGKGQKEM